MCVYTYVYEKSLKKVCENCHRKKSLLLQFNLSFFYKTFEIPLGVHTYPQIQVQREIANITLYSWLIIF